MKRDVGIFPMMFRKSRTKRAEANETTLTKTPLGKSERTSHVLHDLIDDRYTAHNIAFFPPRISVDVRMSARTPLMKTIERIVAVS